MIENAESRENVENNPIEVKAKSVEEAIEQGLAQLSLHQEDVDVEVIKEGKRGVFGIGAEDALVRLTPKPQEPKKSPEPEAQRPDDQPDVTETDSPSPEPPAPTEPPKPAKPAEEKSPSPADKQPPEAEQPTESGEIDAIAEAYLNGLLERMGITAKVVRGDGEALVEPGEQVPLVLDIQGQDLGILIGRRNETLRALQYMLRLMVSKQISRWYPIIVDVESYRVRRRRSLQQLADKMAQRAISSGRRVVLEAMPAYERRIVHICLRDHPAVYTKSVGSDDNRKVTIVPK